MVSHTTYIWEILVPRVEPLDSVTRPIDCLTLLTQSDYTNDNNESTTSIISDNVSDNIPVDLNIKQYLMKGGICILKNSANKTFDFVNEFRIKEAMNILKDTSKSKLTILEILYEVGFNSKSSFNTAFKKHTGKTPTQHRKSAKAK